MLKIAMLSKWHVHAVDYAKVVKSSGNAMITAVWDDDETRGEAWAKELGCDWEPCLDTLLARDDVDAVICDTPTTAHRDVLTRAAKAKKHIFTEKALAATAADCEAIADEIEKAGVTFTISLPQRTEQIARLAKEMVDRGDFGKISFVRIRKAHSGVSGGWLPEYWFEEKDAGGGALMDLGCHPMYMAAWLGGKPVRVTSIMNMPLGSKVDENAAVSIEFENGIIANAETSFISHRTPELLEIYGTDATLIAIGTDVRLYHKNVAAFTQDYITPALPSPMPLPISLFIDACITGTGAPEHFGTRDGIDLTRLLEGAYISNRENRTVLL